MRVQKSTRKINTHRPCVCRSNVLRSIPLGWRCGEERLTAATGCFRMRAVGGFFPGDRFSGASCAAFLIAAIHIHHAASHVTGRVSLLEGGLAETDL